MLGSPPHTWGTPKQKLDQDTNNRITPTYMGNTRRLKNKMKKLMDHPHLHGEHKPKIPPIVKTVGSPPLTWGTLNS